MRVISLGWGCQSFGLAAMVAKGILPPVDAVINADTTHERAETYAFAERWTPWLEDRGVRVVTVRSEHTEVVETWKSTGLMIPAFTRHEDGSIYGMLRRQCTHDWKITPIRRWLQANRNGEQVEMWLGITLDEVTRMKPSGVQYLTHDFPFIEMLDRPWTRGMAMRWLQENGLEIPVKSACIFCPFRDRDSWREIKLYGNGDWQKALEVDEAIRHAKPGNVSYLTAERKPLVECDFSNEEDHGQLTLWDTEECSGMCFL